MLYWKKAEASRKAAGMQQPVLTAQQQAIRQVRERYERGDLSFDQFEYALNALLQAQTPEACQAIVSELPVSPLAALDPVSPGQPAQSVVPAPARQRSRRRWMVNFLGEMNRKRRPWKLAEQTTVLMGLGEVQLDLSLAAIPPQGVLHVRGLIGEVQLFVPRDVNVSVRAFTMLGETQVFGESSEGFFTSGSDEAQAEGGQSHAAPTLEIRVTLLIGEVQVKHVDAPVITTSVEAAPEPPLLQQPQ
jgi:hypothetical protein